MDNKLRIALGCFFFICAVAVLLFSPHCDAARLLEGCVCVVAACTVLWNDDNNKKSKQC